MISNDRLSSSESNILVKPLPLKLYTDTRTLSVITVIAEAIDLRMPGVEVNEDVECLNKNGYLYLPGIIQIHISCKYNCHSVLNKLSQLLFVIHYTVVPRNCLSNVYYAMLLPTCEYHHMKMKIYAFRFYVKLFLILLLISP